MKKVISILLALALVLSLCTFAVAEGTYEIALVTDVGNIDDHSFNQSTWEGVKAFAEDKGITYNYYRPSEDSDEARVESMKSAIDKGAKTIVCPGYLFASSAATVATQYPDVNILLIDTAPDSETPLTNVYSILYQEEQSGFFAGYAAVKDGYKTLGFLGGMAVPAVVRYGYGFVQGADAAASEMGLTDVQIKYWYSDSFAPTDDIKIKMDGWYTEGTEVVFACGGGIYLSAIAAAEAANGKVIGVDVDQALDSDLIITSAMKNLKNSVVLALTKLYDNGGSWGDLGGTTATLGAADDCTGLPTAEDSWRFKTFTVDEYNAIFAKVKSGEIAVSSDIDNQPTVKAITVDYQN
jgi:basic membrane protein A